MLRKDEKSKALNRYNSLLFLCDKIVRIYTQ